MKWLVLGIGAGFGVAWWRHLPPMGEQVLTVWVGCIGIMVLAAALAGFFTGRGASATATATAVAISSSESQATAQNMVQIVIDGRILQLPAHMIGEELRTEAIAYHKVDPDQLQSHDFIPSAALTGGAALEAPDGSIPTIKDPGSVWRAGEIDEEPCGLPHPIEAGIEDA